MSDYSPVCWSTDPSIHTRSSRYPGRPAQEGSSAKSWKISEGKPRPCRSVPVQLPSGVKESGHDLPHLS